MSANKPKHLRSRWTVLATLLIVPMLIYAGVSIGGRWLQVRALAADAESLQGEVIKARSENQRLQTAITLGRTDQSIESVAREELGLVNPGDTPIVLLAPTGTSTATQAGRVVTTHSRP